MFGTVKVDGIENVKWLSVESAARFSGVPCSVCDMNRSHFCQDVRTGVESNLRDSKEMENVARGLGEDQTLHDVNQQIMASKYGLNYYSELLKWPGTRFIDVDAFDLMHAGGGGEDMKHFLKFVRFTLLKTTNIWFRMSEWMRRVAKEEFRLFSTEPAFL
jgi:hypothetical protein